ncbi:MAG TPA: hypothetical protein VM871_00810 [Flavisolibacter sp.]|jgi:hypothetical protein|nr:hypothetical protein [Flavisolibacter sp.]
MEDLFWTTLSIDGKQEEYHIIFENEAYCFIPKDSSEAKYRFRREHDEWHSVDETSEGVKDDAVDALEKYLLQQH